MHTQTHTQSKQVNTSPFPPFVQTAISLITLHCSKLLCGSPVPSEPRQALQPRLHASHGLGSFSRTAASLPSPLHPHLKIRLLPSPNPRGIPASYFFFPPSSVSQVGAPFLVSGALPSCRSLFVLSRMPPAFCFAQDPGRQRHQLSFLRIFCLLPLTLFSLPLFSLDYWTTSVRNIRFPRQLTEIGGRKETGQ